VEVGVRAERRRRRHPLRSRDGNGGEIEEERRLLYVAMTRAKDSPRLMTPQRFFVHGQPAQGDRHVYAARTRFIPAKMLRHFECMSWPLTGAGERLVGGGLHVDVRAKMRGICGIWG
jgi:DNA helicase-2/ATP-dependent DNA helicase PcrA